MNIRQLASLIALTALISVGFADCHSSYTIFRYEMSKCPPAGYTLPKVVEKGGTKVEARPDSSPCPGFVKYHLLTPNPKKPDKTIGYMGYLKIEGATSCNLLVAMQIIGANISPEENDILPVAEPGADLFAKTVFQGTDISTKIPAIKHDFATGGSDFEKWCAPKVN